MFFFGQLSKRSRILNFSSCIAALMKLGHILALLLDGHEGESARSEASVRAHLIDMPSWQVVFQHLVHVQDGHGVHLYAGLALTNLREANERFTEG